MASKKQTPAQFKKAEKDSNKPMSDKSSQDKVKMFRPAQEGKKK